MQVIKQIQPMPLASTETATPTAEQPSTPAPAATQPTAPTETPKAEEALAPASRLTQASWKQLLLV